jgi:hypothetical protein
MAEPRYDNFIAAVQSDPTKPESTIMMAGYIGHGADGQVRIYPDPTLGTWYDVPAADVVHTVPLSDNNLGGSYVWVRASAEIKPGPAAAAAAAPAADAVPAGAAPNVVQPTTTVLTLQPTPATHCFICPPRTIVTETCTPGVACTIGIHCIHPTPTANPTPATLCSPPAVCNLPVSPNCPGPGPGTPVQQQGQVQQFAAAQPAVPNFTIGAGCTFICAQHPQPTLATVCTHPNVCQVQPSLATVCHTVGCTVVGCLTLPINCFPQTLPQVCHVVASPNCPGPGPGTPVQQGFGAQAAMQPTPSAVQHCGGNTAATVCTQPPACHPSVNVICPTPSAVHQCGTAATVCTQPPACHPSVNVICPTPSAVHQCGGNTAATVCTQPPACPAHTVAPACQPSVNVICPTPSAVHQCGVAMAALQPTPSAVNQCGGVAGIQPTPTITIHTHCFAGCVTQQCTVATVCTQPPACPPHTVPPACQVHTLLPVCHPSVNVVCPTPSAVQQCGVFTPFCPQ